MLQAFAHHFNFTQGCVEVTALDTEQMSPRTALALACAAVSFFHCLDCSNILTDFDKVCRTLTLVANNNMAFKSTQFGDMWSAVIPKGSQYEFNKTIWGATTR